MTAGGFYLAIMTICVIAGLAIWLGLWGTRDKNLALSTTPQQRRRSIFHAVFLSLYLFPAAIYFFYDRFEQDGTWHQTIVRDEPVVEFKIIFVILTGALFLFSGVASYLYAITRLTYFATTTKAPYLVVVLAPYLIAAITIMASAAGLMTIDNIDLIKNFYSTLNIVWAFSLAFVCFQVFSNFKNLYQYS